MKSSIQRLSTDQAKPGMVLGEPVLDSGGQVWMPGGETLTQRHIRRLEVRGVPEIGVVVEVPDAPGTSNAGPVDKAAEVRERLARRFKHFEGHEIMQNLRTLAEKHLTRSIPSNASEQS